MAQSVPPLHTQNPRERFSNRADDYAKYRPSYPAAAIDWILQDLGDPIQLTAADVGAGTGISSRLLADRGVTVWAIEPNAAMQTAAMPHPRLTFRTGTAEQTGLPHQSVDLITCCQAFHWFEPDATLAEFHRILKPHGRVVLMWNDRDREDEFTGAYTEAVRRAVDPDYFDRLDRKSSDARALQQSGWFEQYRTQGFQNSHWLDRDGLIGIAFSASYVPKTGALAEQLVLDLQDLYDRWVDQFNGDRVALAYQTNVYLAEARLSADLPK